MFGLSASHIVILFVIVLLFGSRRLPDLGSSMGKTIRNFKKGLEGLDSEDDTAARARLAEKDRNDPNRPKS